jgi:cytochrome c-type biogenesis protein CcsB
MLGAVAAGRPAEFGKASGDLASQLAGLNPRIYPRPDVIDAELTYNHARPFTWTALILALAGLLFLLSFAFEAPWLWWAALFFQACSIGTHGYGYALRWIASGQYPLSNHYESMMMLAAGASLGTLLAECFMRVRVVGLAGSIVAAVTIVLADNVYTFASQSFINPLQPALMNTVWMTIHVPVIMTAYAMAFVLMVISHVYLVHALARPDNHEKLARLDRIQHRMLQITVLFLLAGIILGAVWAGEAWGRPWGWDMKEVWALITLLTYLAVMHARFAGAIKGFGTAVLGVGSFATVVLCYYGVNFLFGKGLHTYGFGAGDWGPLIVFFGLEGVFVAVCAALRRRPAGAKKEGDAPEAA